MTKFWWVRHAPVIGNNGCCYGNNEVDCDTSDVNSFIELEKKLPKHSIVFSSPLSRAIKTFEKVNSLRTLSEKATIIDKRLAEQDIGSWAGIKYEELTKKTLKLGVYNPNWLMGAKFAPPNGESFINLRHRVKDFLFEIIKKYVNQNIIIFSHGGPIRAAILIALNIGEQEILPICIDNTKLTRIDYNNNNVSVVRSINI